jgi:hypothetical protein
MGQGLKNGPGRYILVFALLFLAAGCNGGGSGTDSTGLSGISSDTSMTMMSSFSAPTDDTFGATDTSEGSGTETSGEGVARVHNPEPASMVLFGLGALALLRRKKISAKS